MILNKCIEQNLWFNIIVGSKEIFKFDFKIALSGWYTTFRIVNIPFE